MMAKTEDRPPRRNTALLWALLGMLAVCFSANDLMAAASVPASRTWQPLGVLVINLLMVGAIWGLSRLKPSLPKAVLLSVLLATVAFSGFSVAATVVKVLIATKTLAAPWHWRTIVVFTSNLLIGAGGIAGLVWLQPWKGWNDMTGSGEPVSRATRRANNLYGVKELLTLLAVLALCLGAFSKDHPFAAFSNSPVPLWVPLAAIPSWLLARALREWWRARADEHERRSSDFGRNAAAGVFLAVTPAWWVAARAGLAPQPDAMVLWILAMVVSSIGLAWRRYH